ncbi:MAG: hypothetical protein AB8F65_05785 [Woeseiaceae bacterium]
MKQSIIGLILGVLIGIGLTKLLSKTERMHAPETTVSTLAEADDVSVDEATSLRENAYASLNTIEAILALPGDFAESEATYALAARSGSNALQDLLFEAASMTNPQKRDTIIRILLARLTEIDPGSALALSEGPLNRFGVDYASVVWRQWASREFDTALTEATLRPGNQLVVAQALYSALPSLDDPRVIDIENALGKSPADDVKAKEIATLYSESPALAIGHLNATATPKDKIVIEALAKLMLADTGTEAIAYLEDIADGALRRTLRRSLIAAATEEDPITAIAMIQENDWERSEQASMSEAFKALTKQDADTALVLIADLSPGMRANMEQTVVMTVADFDIDRALIMSQMLTYATEERMRGGLASALVQTNIDRAFEIALGIEDPRARAISIQGFVYKANIEDMTKIADLIMAQPETPWGGNNRLGQVARRWAVEDAEGALAWASALSDDTRSGAIGQIISEIAKTDPNEAVTLVNSLSSDSNDDVRRTLAASLSSMNMVSEGLMLADGATSADAKRSIRLASLNRMINDDPENALALAQQIGDQDVSDVVLSRVIGKSGRIDPAAALSRVNDITNRTIRERTEAQLIGELAKSDIDAAFRRVRSIEPGTRYDSLAAGLANTKSLSVDEALKLTGSIQNERTRRQAELRLLYTTAWKDQEKARALAARLDMDDDDRDQFESMMMQKGVRYW